MLLETLADVEARDIPYCVLRNFEFASGGPLHGDVDVLVPSDHRAELDELLREDGYYRHGGDTTRQTRYRTYVPDERAVVTLDLYWDDPTYNGLPLLDGERVLANRERYEGVWVPSDEDLFVELVFHGALNKNRYRDRYRRQLHELREGVDETAVVDHASAVFGATGVRAVERALEGRLDEVLPMKWRLVAAGLRESPSAAPVLFWNLLVLREVVRPARSVRDRLTPWSSVPVVAVLGPDGAGKSTVAGRVAEGLRDEDVDARVHRLGVHSGASPLLGALRGAYNRVSGSGDDAGDAGGSDQRLGPRGSTWKAAVLLVDWWLRYARAKAGGADVVVGDRYLHELAVYTDPGPLGAFVRLAEAGPFHGVVLTGDPQEIAERSEFDADSVAAFLERLDGANLPTVDTAPGPEAVADAILADAVDLLLDHRED